MKLLNYGKKTEISNRCDDNQIAVTPTTPKTPARTRQPLERSQSIHRTQVPIQQPHRTVEPALVPEPPMPTIKDTRGSVSIPTNVPTTPSPKKRLACSFVGNCVAKQKGIQDIRGYTFSKLLLSFKFPCKISYLF